MIKRIIFVCIVVAIAYYAGTQGLTPGNVSDWFANNDILQTIQEKFNEAFNLVEEQNVDEKAGKIIDKLKEKVSN